MTTLKKIGKVILWCLIGFVVVFALLAYGKNPKHISYGVSFSEFYVNELGLPWKEVYRATLDELHVKKL